MEIFTSKKRDVEPWRVYQKINTTYAGGIAATILDKFDELESIPLLSDRKSYVIGSHSKAQSVSVADSTNRKEEHFCKTTAAINKDLGPYLGTAVDYQIPLKTPKKDDKEYSEHRDGLGKADLLTLRDDTATIVEVKLASSTEHPLKAFMEIFTYWKLLGGENASYFLETSCVKGAKKLEKAVVIIEDTEAATRNLYGKFKKALDEDSKENKKMKELFNKLGVHCYLAKPVAGTYEFEMEKILL